MSSATTIQQLRTPSAEDLATLIRLSEEEGYDFIRRLWDEYASGANRFDQPGEALFGAYGGALIGVGGLNIDPYQADARVGRVRHVYVAPSHRRSGAGRALLLAIIAAARGRFGALTLWTSNPHADALYRAVGFAPTEAFAKTTHALWLELRSQEQRQK
jgi:GNAT superfamily N-acetyltransferase